MQFIVFYSRICIALCLALSASASAQPLESLRRNGPTLILPIDCILGETCFIQKYVDVDPSRRWLDYQCKGLTSDGHTGTDFRILDLVAMEKGVGVRAAAEGVVRGLRNGQTDGLLFDGAIDKEALMDKACGNAVIIEHDDGWQTMYCHLKMGSLIVYRNKRVKAGERIALVGMSGLAEYPHLHFDVRHNGTIVDPFTGTNAYEGCEGQDESLWTVSALPYTEYRPSGILNKGFADREPTMRGIEEGRMRDVFMSSDAPALTYFVRIFGLHHNDVQEISITSPSGEVLVQSTDKHEDRSKAQYFRFVGKRRPEGGWPTGTYVGSYRLIRYGKTVLEDRTELEIDF